MLDWLHGLPFVWLVVVVFGVTYLVAASITAVPVPLAEALGLALALRPHSEGQKVAQREIVVALETALDARRERIIVSESRVNWAKWTGVVLLAALTLLASALVHSERRATTVIANGIFASAVAVCLLMIASQDRPFAGPFAVKPDPLVQVMPGARLSRALNGQVTR